jgi:ankyrin repeat protein
MKPILSERLSRRRCAAFLGGALLAAILPRIASAGSLEDYFSAVKKDDAATISSLLRRGLSPNLIENERGDTGLILALREDSNKVFSVLLNAPSVDLEARARNGDTALMIAAYKGNVGAVKALIEKEVEVNRTGWTALHYAAATGNDEIVRILLDESAYIDAASPNGTTPIMMAARGGHILTVKLLLDEGADVTLKNGAGMTALDFARTAGQNDIVEGLTYRLKQAGKL